MRIAIVNTLYYPYGTGGAERSVRELAESLASRGHDVMSVSLAPASLEETSSVINDVRVERIPTTVFDPFDPDVKYSRLDKLLWHAAESRGRPTARALASLVHHFIPDVVHTNNIAGFGIGAWTAAGTVPLLHTLRDYYLPCPRTNMYRSGSACDSPCFRCAAFRSAHRCAQRRPDVFVGVSQDILERHRKFGYVHPDDETAVVHNAPQLSADSLSFTPNRHQDDFGYLGRIADDKGVWILIEAFKRLENEGASLAIAGMASNDDFKRLTASIQQDSRITYQGTVDPNSFLSSITWLAVPTQWPEPFGRVAAEARMAGCGVIASRTGGLAEVLSLYGGGHLVDAYDDVRSWTAALRDASTVPLPGAPTVERHVGTLTDEYLHIYEKLVEGLDGD